MTWYWPVVAVRAGLAEGHRLAGDVLQLDGDVLEDVPHPGALVLGQPPDEPAGLAVGAAVLLQPRQRGDEAVVERRPELPGGPLLQLAEVHVEPDDGEVSVEARADVDGLVEDAHGDSDRYLHRFCHPELQICGNGSSIGRSSLGMHRSVAAPSAVPPSYTRFAIAGAAAASRVRMLNVDP